MIGFSFVPMGLGFGPGRGLVSFGLMGGSEVEDPVFVIVCLDGTVNVRVSEGGGVELLPAMSGEVLLGPSLSGTVNPLASLDGEVRLRAALTGPVLGRCN